ncbi:hypothetical protein GCM10007860_06200 [Chitiniphilus shinanonensis]|uniref:EAL domain-containing protein n=1 Tax=Chitiniphilus shinanonensis TaxID=553088 RepID=A0ABQ6BSG3_9NEIS|nr:hypothetical protein [Chitiniphilus shinanonensis]GLS03476.1 hypothetical protein GCM10007860_06200 [Chitiniphilus shinanonensis]
MRSQIRAIEFVDATELFDVVRLFRAMGYRVVAIGIDSYRASKTVPYGVVA